MDDPAGLEPPGAGRDRVAELDRPLSDRLALDLFTSGAFDRARHAGSHPEVVVGRVGDRVDLERRDVALDDPERRGFHRRPRIEFCPLVLDLAQDLKGRDFTRIGAWSAAELTTILDLADELKRLQHDR